MSEEGDKGLLDHGVELVARAMDALGLNGTRLRWKWNQRRRDLGEAGMRSQVFWRSTQGRHKMCPSCRALVPRGASRCSECDTSLETVKSPGVGRTVTNLLPDTGVATWLLLLTNGFWFLLALIVQARNPDAPSGLFAGFDPRLLVHLGSGWGRLTLAGEWWRLITPIFLHGGILHFFFNSYILLQLGPIVEEEFGTERFWVLYLACGIAGNMLSQLPRPWVNTVGASGAIFGLMGVLIAYATRGGNVQLRSTIGRYATTIVLFTLLVSFLGGKSIDHFNHAGGFICGLVLGYVVPGRRFTSRTEATFWQVLATAGVLLVVFAFYKVAASAGL